ncbi:unnamed protein product [Calicophoron daubneyi]|uniref:alpha-1,6-mannosyl-glycoprotein 6-beta-N-acetylglucosaminyltransferase n=1 Tax=Calicophoron daubneyi TaxID=300641 RepID=A0AAV2TW39_CALDB
MSMVRYATVQCGLTFIAFSSYTELVCQSVHPVSLLRLHCVCQIKCQHPYIEDYIGEPYSYVVDMDDPTQIRETVKRILSHPVSVGYRTFEFTTTGYLERINALLEHQNFCNHIDSTLGKNVSHTVGSGRPTSTLPVRVVLAETGVSCSTAYATLY